MTTHERAAAARLPANWLDMTRGSPLRAGGPLDYRLPDHAMQAWQQQTRKYDALRNATFSRLSDDVQVQRIGFDMHRRGSEVCAVPTFDDAHTDHTHVIMA